MFTITVPASSANIGPGFDSAGMAINRYLTLEVFEYEQWEFVHRSHFLPPNINYKKHFIYKVAKKIAIKHDKKLRPCKIIVESDIPLARGLGSSASAVVAGIELANQLCGLSLSDLDKLKYATEIEGHPDNVAPAIFGGFVLTAKSADGKIEHIQIPKLDLDIVLYIPDIQLKTKDSRDVLPKSFSRNDAASASGISNMMITALLINNYELAGRMMEQDILHEPYRAKLIPNYQMIKDEARKCGAYGTVISGAGPTMISFVPKGKGSAISEQMSPLLYSYDVASLKIDYKGLKLNLK